MNSKLLYTILLIALCNINVTGQVTPESILNKVLTSYQKSNGVTASFVLSSKEGNMSGIIKMNGEKFVMDSPDMKTWYDGKTQWSYSTVTDEVNITTPTGEELQMINPYSIISSYKNGFKASLAKTKNADIYVLRLIPTKKSDIKTILVTVTKTKYNPTRIVFTTKNNEIITINITKYATNMRHANSIFVFNKKMLPGKEVVDLR